LLLLAVVTARAAAAQGLTGAALQGRITGSDSTPIAGATVLATNLANGERWQATTGSGGRFYIEHLSIGGPYTIQARAVGFSPATRSGYYLSLGQRMMLDLVLAPATVELEPITVVSRADPRINASRTGPEQVIPESTLNRLPAYSRNFADLVRVAPQVSRDLSISGQRPSLNGVKVDGATANDLFSGRIGTPGQDLGLRTLPIEALAELQVASAPFDVRFGDFAGGVVNAVTRSGTNQFEGTLHGYVSSSALVGRDPDGTRGGDFLNQDVGMTLGGPIVRDRAAFFLETGAVHVELPQHFPVIGRDTTGGRDSLDVGIRRASAERFQSILRSRYGVDAGTFDTPIELTDLSWNVLAKASVQLGLNSRLEASHTYASSEPEVPGAGCRERDVFYCLSSRTFTVDVQSHATRLSWTGTLANRVANELRLGRSRYVHRCLPASDFATVFVRADAGELAAGTADFCSNERNQQQILELTDNVSFSAGAHRLIVGTHDELLSLPTREWFQFLFHNQWHFQSLDSLEAGIADRYEAVIPDPSRGSGPFSDLSVTQLGVHVQDQWTPTRKLTLTGGVRFDVPFVSATAHPNALLRQELGIDNTPSPSGHMLWSPRLGVNYDVAGDGNFFLRGGIGIFAGRPDYGHFNDVYVHTGLDALQLDCSGEATPSFVVDPAGQPTACGEGARSASGLVNFFDPATRFPRAFKLALGADRRLPWGVIGTVDFLYARETEFDRVDANLLPPTAQAGDGGRLLYGTIDDHGDARPSRRSSAFGQVIGLRNAPGTRTLSATLQLQKRFPNETELGLSYTYTRSRDRLSDADGGLDGLATDDLERHRRATADWTVPHRITLLATANLPLAIRLSLFYEGYSGAAFTYTVDGDANADGFGGDAVYVPHDVRPGGDVSLATRDTLDQLIPSSPEEYARLEQFIQGERCLSRFRGQLARRNTCRNSWINNTNARFSKLFRTLRGQSVELTLDVTNLLHLFDSDWGNVRGIEATGLLGMIGYDPALGRGIYTLQIPQKRVLEAGASRWRMQLGAHYHF
jgi:hypothetical protein